jgi:hypothetical protein
MSASKNTKNATRVTHAAALKGWFYWCLSKRETDSSLETVEHREMRPRRENTTSRRVISRSRPLVDYIDAHQVLDKRELYV